MNEWEEEKARGKALCTFAGAVHHSLHYYGKIDVTDQNWIGLCHYSGHDPTRGFRLLSMNHEEGFTIQFSKYRSLRFIHENIKLAAVRAVVIKWSNESRVYKMW